MGVDILEQYERRQGGRWEVVNLCQDDQGTGATCPACLERNAELFGILAGVRSVYHVAPVAPRRGLPEDVSPDVAARWGAVQDDPDLFGVSWVGLDELLAYDWDQTIESGLDGHPPVTCRDAARHFVQETLPFLSAQVNDPRDLRLVFWFGH